MKLSMYEAFDLIAEEAVELLAEYDRTGDAVHEYSAETTIRAVLGNRKKAVKKHSWKRTWKVCLLAAVLIMTAVSSISFSRFRGNMRRIDGAELVDETNRDLVGKEMTVIPTIQDAEGNIVNAEELYEAYGDPDPDQFNWRVSSVIRRVQKGAFIPRTIDEFAVREADGEFRTPEVIFENGAMVIFTKEDGSGWHLKKGETLRMDVEEYPSEDGFGNGQGIMFCFIFKGMLMERHEPQNGLELSLALTAKKEGEYYFGIVGASFDPITFKEGKIYVEADGVE